MSCNKEDVAWTEYEYHNGSDAAASADESNIASALFPSDDDDDDDGELFNFEFAGLDPIVIRGESTCGNTKVLKATGLAVWSGGDEMAKYLVSKPELIFGKKVLEVGAGTGISGIIAYRLGAGQVVWTDGDLDALENLRHNVQLNLPDATSPQECPQLIWGQQLDDFRDKYGTFDVILASDCIYMEKCVAPLWETMEYLLNRQSGCVVYVNTCISQVKFEALESAAHQCGFAESATLQKEVHIFRRQEIL